MSLYLQRAREKVSQKMLVSTEDEQKLKELNEALASLDVTCTEALRNIKADTKAEKLSAAKAILERAKVEATRVEARAEIVSKMREINPAWTDFVEKVKRAAQAQAFESVEVSGKLGNFLGKVLNTPIQVILKAKDELSNAAKAEIRQPR